MTFSSTICASLLFKYKFGDRYTGCHELLIKGTIANVNSQSAIMNILYEDLRWYNRLTSAVKQLILWSNTDVSDELVISCSELRDIG
jgi:hypothetical protein